MSGISVEWRGNGVRCHTSKLKVIASANTASLVTLRGRVQLVQLWVLMKVRQVVVHLQVEVTSHG